MPQMWLLFSEHIFDGLVQMTRTTI